MRKGLYVTAFFGGLASLALYGAYRSLANRVEAAKRDSTLELDSPVQVSGEGLTLEAFLGEVSEQAGVEIVLSEEAAGRLDPAPEMTIVLTNPIRLRSVLELLEDFHGLRARVRDGVVHLD